MDDDKLRMNGGPRPFGNRAEVDVSRSHARLE